MKTKPLGLAFHLLAPAAVPPAKMQAKAAGAGRDPVIRGEQLKCAVRTSTSYALCVTMAIACGLDLVTGSPARSALLTFDFAGTVQSVDPKLSAAFMVGDSIGGSYTFSSTAADADPTDPTVGIYTSSLTYFLTAGTFASSGTSFSFNIFDNLALAPGVLRDQYRVALGADGPTVNGLNYNGFTLDLFTNGTNPTSLTSDALPLTPPKISDFALNQLRFYFIDPSNTATGVDYVVGTVSTLTLDNSVSATPLPPSWTMMLMGLAGAGLLSHRRKMGANATAAA